MKMKHLRPLAFVALVAVLAAFVVAPATASAQPGGSYEVPVTGEFTDAVGGTGTFEGVFDVQRFRTQGGNLVATGTLTGTLTDSLGNVLETVEQSLALPVDLLQSSGSCEILNLVLGPLNLDLLGLQVFLDTVTLEITAEPGPGNLLGNLLCAVAGLLDPAPSGGLLSGLAALLNQILSVLSA